MLSSSMAAYVHWPFCQSKCPYCDFNAHLLPGGLEQEAWLKAYQSEIEALARRVDTLPIHSVFFGGGTPSLMEARTVEGILQALEANFGFTDEVEISLEANPGSSDQDKFRDLASAGVNRFSLGVQALNDKDLLFLGRKHSAAESRSAIEVARSAVSRVSIDLIYARPEQSTEDWARELDQAIHMGTEHLSLYQLTIEAGTVFEAEVRRGSFKPMEDDAQADLFEETQVCLAQRGFTAYEVSNFAKPEAECRHNMSYWLYEPYLGLGPGAHGRPLIEGGKWASRNHRMPQTWYDRVLETESGSLPLSQAPTAALQDWAILDGHARFSEALFMGLRLQEGLPFERLSAQDPKSLQRLICALETCPQIAAFCREGWLLVEREDLRLSAAGRQRMNAIVAHLWEASLDEER